MLRRNGSKNTLSRRPLGRSKSTASMTRNPVHDLVSIEPSAAERDAHIAATLSYLKAQFKEQGGQERAMVSRDPQRAALARRNSFTNGPESASCVDPIHWDHSVAAAPRLQRQQSIRFAGPNARPRRALAARASVHMVAPKAAGLILSESGTDFVDNFSFEVESPAQKKLRKHASIQNYKFTPRLNSSVYTPNAEIASQPPFHTLHTLRKSKSMYTPSTDQTPIHFNNCAAGSDSVNRLKEWLAIPDNTLTREHRVIAPELRAPRSMSFISGHVERSHARSDGVFVERGMGCRPEGEGFPLGHSTRLKSQSSLFFRSRNSRQQSSLGLPRTLRNSSENSAAISSVFSGDTLLVQKQAGLRTTARKVSKSLKSRFKGLFGRPKSVDYPAIFAHDQYGDTQSDADSCLRINESFPSRQEASMSRVPSHLPSFHAVPSNQQLKSRQGSFENIRGEDQTLLDDKSRVTSWTNSTTTVINHGTKLQGGWEDHHIAAVREIGAHESSTAQGISSKRGRAPEASTKPIGPIVDSQRVYSALMKRIEGKSQPKTRSMQSRSPEHVRPSPLREESCRTIRCVRQDDDVFQDGTGESLSLHNSAGSTESVIIHRPPPPACKAISTRAARNEFNSSPSRKVAKPSVHLEPPKALQTRNSAFFGSPTCHLFRTASPYRRALRESIKTAREHSQDAVDDSRYLGSLSALSLPTRCPSLDRSERDVQTAYAESVYSCSSSVKRAAASQQNVSSHVPSLTHELTDVSSNAEHGDATIFVNHSVYKPGLVKAHERQISSASSVEWKTWLSANVSKLEASSTLPRTDFPEDSASVRRPFGHVREEAEIEPDVNAVGGEVVKSEASLLPLPLKVVEIPTSTRSISTPGLPSPGEVWRRRSQVFNENTPPTIDRPKGVCSKETSPLMPSRNSLCNIAPGTNANASASLEPRSWCAADLPRMKSLSNLGKSSPIRDELLQKRRSRTRLKMGDSTKSSPTLTAAVERQFGIAKSVSPGWTRPGRFQTSHPAQAGTSFDVDVPGFNMKQDADSQVMGSKKMVESFLSSRRSRIGSGTRQSSDSFTTAFI